MNNIINNIKLNIKGSLNNEIFKKESQIIIQSDLYLYKISIVPTNKDAGIMSLYISELVDKSSILYKILTEVHLNFRLKNEFLMDIEGFNKDIKIDYLSNNNLLSTQSIIWLFKYLLKSISNKFYKKKDLIETFNLFLIASEINCIYLSNNGNEFNLTEICEIFYYEKNDIYFLNIISSQDMNNSLAIHLTSNIYNQDITAIPKIKEKHLFQEAIILNTNEFVLDAFNYYEKNTKEENIKKYYDDILLNYISME